jgi:hypothetical protein
MFAAVSVICLIWTLTLGVPLASDGWTTIIGAKPRQEQIARRLGPLAQASFWINQNTSSSAKVVMFDEVRGYYIDREVLWGEPNHAHELLPWKTYTDSVALATDLQRRGFTTILINNANRGADKGSVSGGWRNLVDGAINNGQFTPLASFGREGRETIVYGINIQ